MQMSMFMFVLQFTILFSTLFYDEVTLDDYRYPSWALTLGWTVVIACLGWLPYIFLVEICRRGTWSVRHGWFESGSG